MTRLWLVIAWLLCAALVCTAAAGEADTPVQADYLLAGSSESLWLVRSRSAESTYDIVVRPVDDKWQWLTEQVQGRPVALTVAAKNLHLVLTKPTGYLVYDLSGRSPTGRSPLDPRWPPEVDNLAVCAAGNMAGDAGSDSAILAVVPRPTQPATAPAETAGSPPPARTVPVTAGMTLGVFTKADIEWEHLSDCPAQIPLTVDSNVFAAVVADSLYVLVAGDRPDRSAILRLRGEDWQEISLAGWPAEARAIGLISMANRPVFILLVPAGEAAGQSSSQANVTLATYETASESFAFQPLTEQGKAAVWDAAFAPQPATFADGLAFVWPEGPAIKFARCNLGGELSAAVPIDVFTRGVEDLRGKNIMDVFAWVLLGAFVAMFLTRPPGASQPFVLPPTMKPGNPVKRVFAAFLDLLPWSAISLAVFRPEGLDVSPRELLDYLRSFEDTHLMPTNLAYFILSSSLLYVAYGTIMERKFGATLGKMIFKLRVVGQEGAKPGWRVLLLRNLVKIIEMSWPVVVLPLALMLFTRNKQRMGDFVARTAVIDTRFAPPPELLQGPPEPPGGPGDRHMLSGPVDDTQEGR